MDISLEKTIKVVVTGSIRKDKKIYDEAIRLHGITASDRSIRISLAQFSTLKDVIKKRRMGKYTQLSLSSVILKGETFMIIFSSGGK